jgi:hypothetical protein
MFWFLSLLHYRQKATDEKLDGSGGGVAHVGWCAKTQLCGGGCDYVLPDITRALVRSLETR